MNPCVYKDMVGVLNLNEATYHSFEDESILDEARDFTTKYLKENQEKIDGRLSALVSHALELPLHWRVPRVEAKWFIGVYEETSGFNPTIVELAKLDFNMVQAIHLEDLKHVSWYYYFFLSIIYICPKSKLFFWLINNIYVVSVYNIGKMI